MCREIVPRDAYALLPRAVLCESIIVHEVAHAIFWQNLGGRKVPRSAHEYVSYVVQIQTLPSDARTEFLRPFARTPRPDLSLFSDVLLAFAPHYFAALAYDHFSDPGNGCRIINGILSGETRFPEVDE